MNEEIILKALSIGGSGSGSIPFADEDGSTAASTPRRGTSRVFGKEELTYPSFEGVPRRELPPRGFRGSPVVKSSTDGNVPARCRATARHQEDVRSAGGCREASQVAGRIALKKSRTDSCVPTVENALQRYENALLKYQKPKLRPKREVSRENSHGYSSSDDSVVRNKSKSTSSIDTQSVNNILDEYEDLDYRRSSDLSDVGSINVNNFEVVMNLQRSRLKTPQATTVKTAGSGCQSATPPRPPERSQQPVLKVNQQTQVRQRSRDRQREERGKLGTGTDDLAGGPGSVIEPRAQGNELTSSLPLPSPPPPPCAPPISKDLPDLLMRKGEVQKRVDEWLSQTQSQHFNSKSDKVLVARSNSNSDRRRNNSELARSSAAATSDVKAEKTSETAFPGYEESTNQDSRLERRIERVSVGVNTSRGTYKEYLATRNRTKQQDYGFTGSSNSRPVDQYAPGSRIPQREPPNSSFRSKKLINENGETTKPPAVPHRENGSQRTLGKSSSASSSSSSSTSSTPAIATQRASANGPKTRSTNPVHSSQSNESSPHPLLPVRRSSFKRTQHGVNQNAGVLIKEETGPRTRPCGGGGSGGKGSSRLEETTVPNKDGESRRPLLPEPVVDAQPVGGDRRAGDSGKSVDRQQQRTEIASADSGAVFDRAGDKELRRGGRQRQEPPQQQYGQSRLVIDCRKEEGGKNSIYGQVVASRSIARVRNETTPGKALVSESSKPQKTNCNPLESRKLPVPPPAKDQSTRCDNQQVAKCPTMVGPASSFKPNNAMYATLQQPQQQQVHHHHHHHHHHHRREQQATFATSTANESVTRSHYATPKHIEKIYERSHRAAQVIHANDLESILKPVVPAPSAYGERLLGNHERKQQQSQLGHYEESVGRGTCRRGPEDEDIYECITDVRHADQQQPLETIVEDQRSEECGRLFPEIGLSQCLKVQQKLPNGGRVTNRGGFSDQEFLPDGRSWEEGRMILNDPPKTFSTFQGHDAIGQAEEDERLRSQRVDDDALRGGDTSSAVPIPIREDLDANSLYETRSTLKLSSDPPVTHPRESSSFSGRGATRDVPEPSESCLSTKVNDEASAGRTSRDDKSQRERANSLSCSSGKERCDVPAASVVNEILVRNLQFKQDMPVPLPPTPADSVSRDIAVCKSSKPAESPGLVAPSQKSFNCHSVLSDDYANVLAQEALTGRSTGGQGCKVYVTKEEMERQKLMDLLKKGDYEMVKLLSSASRSGSMRRTSGASSAPITIVPIPRRTPTTSTGIGSSITDEIWTSANDRKFCRTSTTSTGIGSSLNLHDNNRSLESRDGDFYSTDIEDSKETYRRFYPNTPTTSGLGSSSDRQSVETHRSRDLPDHLWASAMEDGFSRFNAMKSLQTITRQPRPNHDWVRTERISRFTKHRTISQSPQREPEIWTSKLNEADVSSGCSVLQRIELPHRCHHQARRSFSTSIVADLAATPSGSQQSLGSGEFLELERSYTLSTPGGSSPVCCPPCSPPPAPAAYISSARASSRRLGGGNGLGGPSSPERDSLANLLRFLKTFYRELATRDPPHLPPWTSPLALGTLCPAHFQPHLQLVHKSEQEHRLENIRPDQIFAPVRLSDGTISEAPRRVAIEGGPGSGRTTLCLRLLHHWATQDDGPVLAFIIPLRELRGSTLLNYLSRELVPRTTAMGDAVAQVWRNLHLMQDRVLFVLDGYDECVGGRASLGDAVDLLERRLFPEARILVTCSPTNSPTLSPLVQRRIHLAGLEWPHVERLCVAYFIHNYKPDRAYEFLEELNVQPQSVKQLGQHPLGWIMLCTLYQDAGGLPSETSALIQAALKCIVKRSLDPPVLYHEEIPGHCRKRLEDFGKLSLAALREGRCCYTEAELRTRGGGIEVTRLGFLTRGLTFGQRRKSDLYTPIHMAVAEFLAAYYLTSVAQYPNILRRELEGLPPGIISHLAGLLGPKTHLILNQLCPLEVPPRAVFSLLKAAGASDDNIAAVCRLVGAGPGFGPAPNERPPAPLVHTAPLELEGWARILKSPACTLEALEIVFQLERGSDPTYLDDFFEALAGNESVKLVRLTSLLGQEFLADEAQRLAGHLKSVLGKKRLNDFELVITCLEESAHDRLECVVNALCRGLSHASVHLARLVLDMNLSGEQVSRVCAALRDCVQVQALHLPHLGCGCEGLASVAELLKERPLLALNLAGSWGAKNEDPSSSGISMGSGSGSGSSGCASSTLGTLPLNRCYSSLPRGALAAYGSLTRPATLPRLPLSLGLSTSPGSGTGPLPQNDRDRDSNGSSKRNSDSVLCHRLPLLHPLPTCDTPSHQGTGFHEIFNAIREPNCKLRSLNVSKCLLGGLDAGCLGETIRRARNLDALKAAGASRPTDVMPLVLALTEAPCLQLLDLASPRLALDDHPSRLLCHALARNRTLRWLSLEGWTFRIEESDSLAVFSELLRYTNVRELSLCNARLHLAVHEGPLSRLGRRDDAGAELLRAAPPPVCPAIVFLRLAGFQVTVNDRLALRGPLLLPFLAGFTALNDLDLSLDKSTIGGNSGSLLFIDDKILQHFFACLASHFKQLLSLRINFWRISLEDSDRTIRQIAKHLKLCNLSFLKANGLIVTDSAKKVQMEHVFVQTALTNLQGLTWLCVDGVDLSESQASCIGKCIRDRFPGTNLEISAKDVNVKAVKALVTTVEEGGRAEVVYTGGSNCRLKIAKIQKSGKSKKK